MVLEYTEKLFAEFLKQERISFEYEPQDLNPTHPDFKFEVGGLKYLVEIEDIEVSTEQAVNFQGLLKSGSSVYSINRQLLHKQIKRKIDSASDQLKLHAADFDQLIILIGHRSPLINIDSSNIFAAMTGDDYLSIALKPLPDSGIAAVEVSHRVNGAFRFNSSDSGEMQTRHKYISAVGFVERFRDLDSMMLRLNLISNSLGNKPLSPTALIGTRVKTSIPDIKFQDI